MATVPGPILPEVTPHSDPTGPISGQFPDVLGKVGESLSNLGATEKQAGAMLAEHAVKFQEQNNAANADTASTSFGAKAVPLYEGYNALQGQARVDALPKFTADLEDLRQSEGSTLNKPARLQFDADTRRLQFNFLTEAGRSATAARQQYIEQAKTGSLDMAINQTPMFIGNPEGLEQHLAALDTKADEYADYKSYPPEMKAANRLIWESKARSSYLDAEAFHDPATALHDFNQWTHDGKLSPEDQIHLQDKLASTNRAFRANTVMDNIMRGVTMPPLDEFIDKVIQPQEGLKLPDGSWATSPKGAEGPFQIEPAIAQGAARELGIPYDENKLKTDMAYGHQLAKQVFQDNLGQFGGNWILATMAYNAGAARVQDYMNGTDKSGKNPNLLYLGNPLKGETTAEAFAQSFPIKETRDYVAKAAASLPKQTPTQMASLDLDKLEGHMFDEAQAAAGYGDPMFANTLVNMAHSRINQLRDLQRDQQRDGYRTVLSSVMGNPAQNVPPVKDPNQIFSSPALMNVWSTLQPEKQKAILSQIQRNASERNAPTPDDYRTYQKFRGMANTDPDGFNRLDLADANLPGSMKMKLIDMQTKHVPDVNVQHAIALPRVQGMLSPFGITKASDPDKYYEFTGKLEDQMDAFKAVHNRLPNDADIEKISQSLLLYDHPDQIFKGQQAFEHEVTGVKGVPDEEARQIAAQVRLARGFDPTPDQIIAIYGKRK